MDNMFSITNIYFLPFILLLGSRAEEYQLPYYQFVSHDPSLHDMRKVVVTEMMRPPVETWWKNDEVRGEGEG